MQASLDIEQNRAPPLEGLRGLSRRNNDMGCNIFGVATVDARRNFTQVRIAGGCRYGAVEEQQLMFFGYTLGSDPGEGKAILTSIVHKFINS